MFKLLGKKKAKTKTKEEENCTFTPKVNDIPLQMEAALIYTQQDPFERLSRPKESKVCFIHVMPCCVNFV